MTSKSRSFSAICLGILLLVSGCAIGNTISYHHVVADITASGNQSVAVGTHDQREYILSGRKKPRFVGVHRDNLKFPHNVNTESGKPLSEEMSEALATSLSKKGFKTNPVVLLHSDSPDVILQKLRDTLSDLFVLLTLKEWNGDTGTYFFKAFTTLIYDVNLKIYSKTGSILAEKNINGRDQLEGSFWDAPGYAKEAVPEAFKKKIEELFNDPQIVSSLQYKP